MNIKTELFIAMRYLKPKFNANSAITVLSLLGVVVGVMVLIVVLAVMTGMTRKQELDLLAVISHVEVAPKEKDGVITEVNKVVKAVSDCGVVAAPLIEANCVVQVNKHFDYQNILGVDSLVEKTPLNVSTKLMGGKYQLDGKKVVISSAMARSYGLRLGSSIVLHSPARLGKMVSNYQKKASENKREVVYLPEEYEIVGIYMADRFDKHYIYMDIDEAADFIQRDWGVATTIYTRVDDPMEVDSVEEAIAKAVPELEVQSWKKVHKEWLSILAMEKTMMMFLLTFVVIVAAFSIANTLITVTIQKTREIGLLKSIGATSGSIMRIFIFQGVIVGVVGAVVGVGCGVSVVYFRNALIGAISSILESLGVIADFYFLNNMPAQIIAQDVYSVAAIAIVLCSLGGLLPAWRASKLDPAKALRYE